MAIRLSIADAGPTTSPPEIVCQLACELEVAVNTLPAEAFVKSKVILAPTSFVLSEPLIRVGSASYRAISRLSTTVASPITYSGPKDKESLANSI